MKGTLVQVYGPNFTAGLVARDGRVVTAAPILRYMLGWTGTEVATYCAKRRWTWRVVVEEPKDDK